MNQHYSADNGKPKPMHTCGKYYFPLWFTHTLQ